MDSQILAVSKIPLYLLALLILYAVWRCIFRQNKLAAFPGPWLASFTDLWLVWHAYVTKDEVPMRSLHAKYGDVVRVGPNKLAFAKWEAARDIQNVSLNLKKSDWYSVQSATVNGELASNSFTSTDIKYHTTIKRLTNRPFNSATAALQESKIETVLNLFVSEIRRRFADKAGSEGIFDLSEWIQYYTYDALAKIGFGEHLGYLESGSDFLQFMKDGKWYLIYFQYVALAPWLDRIFLRNPILLWFQRRGFANKIRSNAAWALGHQFKRAEALKQNDKARHDLLDMFLEAQKENPETLNDFEVSKLLMGTMNAGADTVAMLLAAIFRYVLKHPEVYSKLQEEIDNTSSFSYRRPADGPYLDAVIKETARLFPVVRFPLERVSPSKAMMFDGTEVPASTKIGVSPWVISRDPDIWGRDADDFRPERWLLDSETYRSMASKLLLFGIGKYQCQGIHIAYTEVYKIVPGLLKAFKLELADSSVDWKWEHGEFVFINGLHVRATSRQN